jgi:dodecin
VFDAIAGATQAPAILTRRLTMAKKDQQQAADSGVYKVVEVIGSSATSWEDAAKKAVEMAAGSLRDLRIAEVIKNDVKLENGKVVAYRTRLSLSFKYEA